MTRYVDLALEPGEVLRHRTTLSRIIYKWPAIITIAVTWMLFQANEWGDPNFDTLAFFGFALCACLFMSTWTERYTTEIAVTSRRLIYKTGFVRRTTDELNMDKIASVKLNQSTWGRWLDYGDIRVNGVWGGDWGVRQSAPWRWWYIFLPPLWVFFLLRRLVRGNSRNLPLPVDSPLALRASMTQSGGANA